MIRALLVGCARILFNLACVGFVLGLLFMYGAYRLLRSAVARDSGRPVRDAGFDFLRAGVTLARAVAEQLPVRPPVE